ncbi:folate/biopterin transporter [Synechococcus sp. 63AY4M2]|uniref:folate/biopterin family MFS transporter n=1 Tax=unclassified Synechococcus TaxID=2626047 RepID=UPI0000694876|nr:MULTISPECIES: folate/biopterin family MFS transporter [unclassified Synechococcus]ABD00754.1 transporter, folate-biopterin transporter (FBT) family [Synechococcus sp. JA-3-3Ab]PIK86443.1 folate/biopterin transporter [Synechococcus sp. 63AY4M2]PIK91808.1 folate/biopterin transporter [Synechococcus sp. 65AY6Li]
MLHLLLQQLRRSTLDPLQEICWTPELIGILLVYFVQGAVGLARLATSFYLKDSLGLGPAQTAALMGFAVIPWTLKPLYGLLSDTLPLAGYRRRPYLLLSGLLGCGAWLGMALWAPTAELAMLWMVLGSLAVAVGDVIVDSLVVERVHGSDWAGTGTLQSLSWGATALGSLLTAYAGGALLAHYPPQVVFGLTALLPLLIALAAWVIVDQPVACSFGWDPLRQQVGQVWRALRQPSILLPVLFVFIWQATPSADVALFYFFTSDLGFGPGFLGQVRLVTSVASLVGVAIFQVYLRRIPLRPLFGWMTVLSAGLGLTSLILVYHLNRAWGIDDHWFSLGDSLVLTVAGQIAFMPVLVLAARLCPPGIEATLFALLMSAFNLAGFLSQELGSLLMHALGVTESDFSHLGLLLLLTNLSTLLPLPLLGWVPEGGADLEAEAHASLEAFLQEVRAEEAEAGMEAIPLGQTDITYS